MGKRQAFLAGYRTKEAGPAIRTGGWITSYKPQTLANAERAATKGTPQTQAEFEAMMKAFRERMLARVGALRGALGAVHPPLRVGGHGALAEAQGARPAVRRRPLARP